ncbi:hypothetical protein SGCZBJ_03720 [Caulobacter zeae]|uniref:Uncharacterized protein n=1 Tax=Caulobacter zeae TaxID=2055137 RepID=A0A2N5DPZ4_9CAUL|nr:hypothetical protein [Caulobacter zeae]PLR28126.1 hypothetical protein SGCZBJ_03720 [Caulobacter zeae]
MSRDPRIKRHCPFCSERDHLHIVDRGALRPIIRDGATVLDPDGTEELEEVDGAFCQVCSASAPLDVWNNEVTPDTYAILRDIDLPTEPV